MGKRKTFRVRPLDKQKVIIKLISHTRTNTYVLFLVFRVFLCVILHLEDGDGTGGYQRERSHR